MTFSERCALLAPAFSGRAVAGGVAPWLNDELVATEAATVRLRRWVDLGAPVADPRNILLQGRDATALAEVIGTVLAQLPPPVGHHVVQNVTIECVGRLAAGWCATRLNPPAPLERPLSIVVDAGIDAGEIPAVVAHEIAHAWLHMPVHLPDAGMPTADAMRAAEARLEAVVTAWGVDPRPRLRAREELQVATLARAWGLRGNATDVARYAQLLRQTEKG